MKLLFVHDTYYTKTPHGDVYSYGAFPYSLWKDRFLPHFDEITVIGREKTYDKTATSLDVSSGENVTHVLLPNVNTPLKRLFGSGAVKAMIHEHVRAHDAVVTRGPVEFGMIAAQAAKTLGKPYAVEMSGCAFDHTWYHGSIIGKLYAPVKYLRAKKMVQHANATIYVTEHFLQKRYPCSGITEYASNVELTLPGNEASSIRLRRIDDQKAPIKFGLIGNFGNKLKGLHIALDAFVNAKNHIPDFELHLLGQANRDEWVSRLTERGLENKVIFHGTVPGGDAVYQFLDSIDIYIQPSFHEGLPRAVIEAMSRGCPVLTSDAGGTDELIDQTFIHRRGDVGQLTRAIKTLSNDKRLQAKCATQNFKKAKEYDRTILQERRANFWNRFTSECIS